MSQNESDLSFKLDISSTINMNTPKQPYSLPENYNSDDYPPVKMRNNNHTNKSETERKRRSKNRLSNRRSTGFIPKDVVDEAIRIGADGEELK